MALQSRNLVMVGLGIVEDRPPNSIQPKLADGIHLRWAFAREVGFPWHGYYLFRRQHRPGTLECVELSGRRPGTLPEPKLQTKLGTFESNRNLLLTDDFPPTGSVEFDLNGREWLQFTFLNGMPARRVRVRFGFRAAGQVDVSALLEDIPVANETASGGAGEVVEINLEFDAITAVKIGRGPAALVEICFVPVAQEAAIGWETVPGFTYPMRLPVTHPGYPCTPGASENLGDSRILAGNRIKYGEPGRLIFAGTPVYAVGEITVTNGSPIVKGIDTNWGQELVGKVLQVTGDATAYTILRVIKPERGLFTPEKLILSRGYEGPSNSATTYEIREDAFAPLHDYLVHLVRGGPASSPMVNRFLPVSIYTEGTVNVVQGSASVFGTDTSWTEDLTGLSIQIADERTAYTIVGVFPPRQLRLDRGYIGEDAEGKPYQILSILKPPGPDRDTPHMPEQRPLDLVLLGALNPAVAQMAGLYWVDETTEYRESFDYVILADLKGDLFRERIPGSERNPDLIRDWLNQLDPKRVPVELKRILSRAFNSFYVDGWIVFNKRKEEVLPLAPPGNFLVYALPGTTGRAADGGLRDVRNSAGLEWNLGLTRPGGALLPGNPVMYHLWRADLGEREPTFPPEVDEYRLLTGDPERGIERPILVTRPDPPLDETPQRPAGWPSTPMQAIDSGLANGWYSYRVNGIDIFGRHTLFSEPAPWYQWEPIPDPHPWYYVLPPEYRVINDYGVRLLDKMPPPPPAAIEAFALDPEDRTVRQDEDYKNWRRDNVGVVGLRVRWQWTEAHQRQAPNTREFRVYYQPGQMNALLGRTGNVRLISSSEAEVDTDFPSTASTQAYVGTVLRIGSSAFKVIEVIARSAAESPLRLKVTNVTSIDFAGTVSISDSDRDRVSGDQTNWQLNLAGKSFQVREDLNVYTIQEVISRTELRLDRDYYTETDRSGLHYQIYRPAKITTVGRVSVQAGSTKVIGKDSNWRNDLAGMALEVGENLKIIERVDSPVQLTLAEPHTGSTVEEVPYSIYRMPRASAPCTLVLPPPYTTGKVTTTRDRTTVDGTGTNWGANLVGRDFKVLTDNDFYLSRINAVDPSRQQITLDRPYEGRTGTGLDYVIRHPLFEDFGEASAWKERIFVVSIDEHVRQVLRRARDSRKNFLRGDNATSTGMEVTLHGSDIDISGLRVLSEILPPHLLLAKDLARPSRLYRIVDSNDHVNTVTVDGIPSIDGDSSAWEIVFPIRQFEVFLPAPETSEGQPFFPSLAEPIVYAHIGVSAADDNENESRMGSPAKIFRVRREQPQAPITPPADSDRVYATPADYHSHSFYTYRWQPADNLKTHIFRALDDAVFKLDWELREPSRDRRPTLDPNRNREHLLLFPSEAIEPLWDATKRQHVANELNELNDFPHNEEGKKQGMAYYRGLSNDAMRVLAGLPDNERAFTQITIRPLDPDNPVHTNKRGPDDPDDFELDLPDHPFWSSSLCIYIDTLDGRSTNRYFYRAAYVDAANNRSLFSLSSPPVYLPNVIPPRAPVITKVIGGDRQITLKWASNREPDLKEYRIYRADSVEAARDLRLMLLVHTERIPPGDPATRPAEVAWRDEGLPGLVSLYYRLMAVADTGNTSRPSELITASAYDETPPVAPVPDVSWLEGGDGTVYAEIIWSSSDQSLLQRFSMVIGNWHSLTGWQSSGEHIFKDDTANAGESYKYRIWVRKASGLIVKGNPVRLEARLP